MGWERQQPKGSGGGASCRRLRCQAALVGMAQLAHLKVTAAVLLRCIGDQPVRPRGASAGDQATLALLIRDSAESRELAPLTAQSRLPNEPAADRMHRRWAADESQFASPTPAALGRCLPRKQLGPPTGELCDGRAPYH